MSHFNPNPLKILALKGNMVTASRENYSITRNISFFKKWMGKSMFELENKLINKESQLTQIKSYSKTRGILLVPFGQENLEKINSGSDIGVNRSISDNSDSLNSSTTNVENDSRVNLLRTEEKFSTGSVLDEEEADTEKTDSDDYDSNKQEIETLSVEKEKTLSFIDEIGESSNDDESNIPRRSKRNQNKPQLNYNDNRQYNKK